MATKITYRMASGYTVLQIVGEELDVEDVRCMLVKHKHMILKHSAQDSDVILATEKIEFVTVCHTDDKPA